MSGWGRGIPLSPAQSEKIWKAARKRLERARADGGAYMEACEVSMDVLWSPDDVDDDTLGDHPTVPGREQ